MIDKKDTTMHLTEAPSDSASAATWTGRHSWSMAALVRRCAIGMAREWLDGSDPPVAADHRADLLGQTAELLVAVATAMERQRRRERRLAGERAPDSAAACPELMAAAARHAQSRLCRNATLAQLLGEYGRLRALVADHWARCKGRPGDDLRELARLDAALDCCRMEAARCCERQWELRHHLAAGVLGHELRDPLNTILLTAESLGREQPAGEDLEEVSGRLRRSARHMKQMVGDLLSFGVARLDQRLPVQRRPIPLAPLVSAIAHDLTLQHPGETISITFQGHSMAVLDAVRFEQLLWNLASNAIKFKAAGTVVSVLVENRDDGVHVSVHNEGAPIAPETQRVLFEPFVRGADDERGQPGVGLGLFVCREIARAHGGSLTVSSSAERGTTFTATLRGPGA